MIICAGLPKTGSKSCSTALRTLGRDYTKLVTPIVGSKLKVIMKLILDRGYNVADFMETLELLAIP